METTTPPTGEAMAGIARPRHKGPTVEMVLWAVLLLLAIATRFALLGAMALHHDEGIHARFGWDIYRGHGWTHDAVYHGPVIYHMEALGFFLFGDSDATSRVILAAFSVATTMLPFLLRRQLGRWGALLASFLFLISPSFLYFGRFGHPDVFGSFFTLLCFVGIVRYLADRKPGWLYTAAVATCMHFSAKPTAYIVTAIFLVYLAGRLLWERYDLHAFWPVLGLLPAAAESLWKAQAQESFPLEQIALGPLKLSALSLAALVLAGLGVLGMLAWRWYEGWGRDKPSPTMDLLVTLGTLVLPLLSAVPLNMLLALAKMEPLDYHTPDIAPQVVSRAVLAIGAMFAASAVIGLLWNRRRWAIAAGLFWGLFFLLHTSFFSSMTGWATGLVQALGFWLTQQEVKRIHVGPQYYLILMSVYEPVAFLFGWIGAAYFAWKGLARGLVRRPPAEDEPAGPAPLAAAPNAATGLLVLWAPLAFAMYSFAGEQVPWLNLHPTLPFILTTAAFLGRVVAHRPRRPTPEARRRWADRLLLLAGAGLLLWAGRPLLAAGGSDLPTWLGRISWTISAALLLALAYLAFGSRDKSPGEAPFLLLGGAALGMAVIGANLLSYSQAYEDWRLLYVPLGILLAATIARVVLLGKIALRSAALLICALLCTYGAASAFRLTYRNNDTPVEMLVYVQSGSDVQWAMDKMATLSTLTTGGRDMVFLYDADVAWPFEWYLRNYTKKVYQPTIAGPPAADVTMAFVYRDKDNTSKPYLESRFYPIRYYIFNWWFPEDTYRSVRTLVERLAPETIPEQGLDGQLGLGDALRAIFSYPGQARAWRFYMFREILSPLGAREFALYVRRDLVLPLRLLEPSIPRRW